MNGFGRRFAGLLALVCIYSAGLAVSGSSAAEQAPAAAAPQTVDSGDYDVPPPTTKKVAYSP